MSWTEHMFRHDDSFSFQLLRNQPDSWLRDLRTAFGSTFTRSGPGAPQRWQTKWFEAIESSLGWDNASRDSSLSRQRVEMLMAYM